MSPSTVVFITGVSSGIGHATAERFAQRGCRVFGSVRNAGKAEAIPGVELVEMDVRDDASVRRAVDAIVAQAGRIDVLVNNAGGTLLGAVEETSVTEAQALFDTNLFGILRTTHAALPHMRQQRSGRIVNVSSVLGFLPAPYMGLYAASKHAVEGLSESLDHEVRPFGIRVVLVEPAYTRTSLDLNAPRTARLIDDYATDRNRASQAIARSVEKAPTPDGVAATIVDAALNAWTMRHTPKGEASLLRKLRRFMPAGPVDASLRKNFGLGWTGYRINFEQNTADNASAGQVVIGPRLPVTDLMAIDTVAVRLHDGNDHTLGQGVGADADGHPLDAMARLARELAAFDQRLEAGDLVLTGGLTKACALEAGARLVGVFSAGDAWSVEVAARRQRTPIR